MIMSPFAAVPFWFAHILSALCLLTLDYAIKPFQKAWKEPGFAVNIRARGCSLQKGEGFQNRDAKTISGYVL